MCLEEKCLLVQRLQYTTVFEGLDEAILQG